jgi:hypothetical protein
VAEVIYYNRKKGRGERGRVRLAFVSFCARQSSIHSHYLLGDSAFLRQPYMMGSEWEPDNVYLLRNKMFLLRTPNMLNNLYLIQLLNLNPDGLKVGELNL